MMTTITSTDASLSMKDLILYGELLDLTDLTLKTF